MFFVKVWLGGVSAWIKEIALLHDFSGPLARTLINQGSQSCSDTLKDLGWCGASAPPLGDLIVFLTS